MRPGGAAGRAASLGALGGLAALLVLAAAAGANVITPDTRADEPPAVNGNCTLREAVIAANTDAPRDRCRRGSGDDVIELRRGRYTISVPGSFSEPGIVEGDAQIGDLDIGQAGTGNLTIRGHRAGTTIDATLTDRHFQVFGVRATFRRLTLTRGSSRAAGGAVSLFGAGTRGRFVATTMTASEANGPGGALAVGPGAAATLRGGAVRGNRAAPGSVGGGIQIEGALELVRARVAGNRAGSGGGLALASGATATLRRARLTGNEAQLTGGGARATTGARLAILQSTVAGNRAGTDGGGLLVAQGELLFRASTLSGNRANERGGGLALSGGDPAPSVLIVNSTVSGNVADADASGGPAGGEGGGLSLLSNGSKRVVSSTVTGNRASRGGGILGPFGGTGNEGPVLRGTIVAGNSATHAPPGAGPDCFSGEPVTSDGFNLLGSLEGCTVAPRASDITGRRPRLGPLARNGGPTPTHALRRRSPAVDSGPRDAPARDQRGARRKGRPDIGSFERR